MRRALPFCSLLVALAALTPAARAQSSEVYPVQVCPDPASTDCVPRSAGPVVTEQAARAFIDGRLAGADRTWLGRFTAGAEADENVALVRQDGDDNRSLIEQAGRANVAVLYQTGDGNTALVQQTGRANVFGAWLEGDANAVDVTQRGDGNTYLLDFVGTGLDHAVVQIGRNNRAVQVGVGDLPFGIEQRGNDMQVTVRHNAAR